MAPAPGVAVPAGTRGVWPRHLTRDPLEAHGIPVPPARLATTAVAATGYGQPVAVKMASAALAHKLNIGGVRLGVETAQVAATWRRG